MDVALVVVAWVLGGAISAFSAANQGRITLSEFFIFLLLGPLGSAHKSKQVRHREMLEQFRRRRPNWKLTSGRQI
jgi:hypothetical protein